MITTPNIQKKSKQKFAENKAEIIGLRHFQVTYWLSSEVTISFVSQAWRIKLYLKIATHL